MSSKVSKRAVAQAFEGVIQKAIRQHANDPHFFHFVEAEIGQLHSVMDDVGMLKAFPEDIDQVYPKA